MRRQLLWADRTPGEYPEDWDDFTRSLHHPPWDVPYVELDDQGAVVGHGVYKGLFVADLVRGPDEDDLMATGAVEWPGESK